MMSEWISVDDKLKPVDQQKILVSDGKHITCGWYIDYFDDEYPVFEMGGYDSLKLKGITHWMPLPEPPEGLDDKSSG